MDKIEIENLTINEKTSVIALLTGEKRKRSNYTHLCRTITKSLDKKVKRKNGVYFTPPSTVEHILLTVLGEHIRNMKNANRVGAFVWIVPIHQKNEEQVRPHCPHHWTGKMWGNL